MSLGSTFGGGLGQLLATSGRHFGYALNIASLVQGMFDGLWETSCRFRQISMIEHNAMQSMSIAQHECTSSSVLGGKRSQLCLCCRPTHSPSGSPIRTTSSIRCGAGTVGYWTDWPGDCHSPGILKLTIVGVRRCSLTAGSWSQHLQPHRSGSTVGGGSPR